MVPGLTIAKFKPSAAPITAPITKFGGQPTWLKKRQWPISEEWDKPMRFLCQIALPPFLCATPKLAYIFVTHPDFDEDWFDPDIMFPDGGENAVIIQPGGTYAGETKHLAKGPTLFLADGSPAEFEVDLIEREDPDFRSRQDQTQDSQARHAYLEAVYGDKIGGTPAFFQGEDWPEDGSWKLLLQLNTNWVPFYFNLGAAPQAMAFINADCTEGRFLVQDS